MNAIDRNFRPALPDAIEAEQAREFLDYDRLTGVLTWRRRDRKWFATDRNWRIWNTRFAGTVAGSPDKKGYLRIAILSRSYKAHRLAYLIVTSNWPPHQIDHQNHVLCDNSWENIRPATSAENGKNTSISVRNTSGAMGVHWHRKCQKWCAQINLNGASTHLGLFATKAEAAAARKRAEAEHGFHENHGRVAA
jgi:hypothetical protein